MSEATKRMTRKRVYVVQSEMPGEPGRWFDSATTGDSEQDAVKNARAAKLVGKLRVIRVCGVYSLAEQTTPRIVASRVE